MRLSPTALLFVAIVLACPGCNKDGESGQATKVEKKKPLQPASETKASVTQIGFLDQKECCECTRTRIDNSWKALQAELGPDNKLPVERIHVDIQAEQAENFRRLRAYQVLPAIYFLDDKGNLVEMLQGEVKPEAFRKVLP